MAKHLNFGVSNSFYTHMRPRFSLTLKLCSVFTAAAFLFETGGCVGLTPSPFIQMLLVLQVCFQWMQHSGLTYRHAAKLCIKGSIEVNTASRPFYYWIIQNSQCIAALEGLTQTIYTLEWLGVIANVTMQSSQEALTVGIIWITLNLSNILKL